MSREEQISPLQRVCRQSIFEFQEEEIKMNEYARKKAGVDKLAWGGLFIWWGVTLLVPFPAGVGLIGVGLILLAANAVRQLQGMGINGFSTGIGILALVWGGLELAGAVMRLPFDLPIFAILIIVLGVLILIGNRGEDALGPKEA
jgi:hypothetical protein